MAEETLVEGLVGDSFRFVEELDKAGSSPTNVLWYFFSDAEEWRLLVAGPEFDKLLPRDEPRAYQSVARALMSAGANSLSVADVKVVRTDDPILVATRFVLKTPQNGLVRVHFRDNTFNGIFVKEMVVVRAA